MKFLDEVLAIALSTSSQTLQQPSIRTPILISLGAIAGALSRYYIGIWLAKIFGENFPYGTFFVNITGCIVMGFFFTLVTQEFLKVSPEFCLWLGVGFLGSYTTFSSYQLDSVKLLIEGNCTSFAFYWLGSAVLGLFSIKLGITLANCIKF